MSAPSSPARWPGSGAARCRSCQHYGQRKLVPLAGQGLKDGEPLPIDGSEAGRCFLSSRPVEVPSADGTRVHVPLLDGGDRAGVLAVTLDTIDDDDRRLLRRIAGVLADVLQTKNGYTDLFFRTRGEAMSVATPAAFTRSTPDTPPPC